MTDFINQEYWPDSPSYWPASPYYWPGGESGDVVTPSTPSTTATVVMEAGEEVRYVYGYEQARSLPLVVYEPLTSGTQFIDEFTFVADGLSPVWTAFGGYWSMRFNITARQTEIEDWIDGGLGRHVELYSSDLVKIWEGFVSSVSANIGGLSIERGPLLDTVANRIYVMYSTVDTSVTPPAVGVRETTAAGNNTASQAKYGIIERVISVGGANSTTAEQIRDVALEEFQEPQTSERDNLNSGIEANATIEVLGYMHWLKAFTVDLNTTGTQTASAKVAAVLGEDPNSIFSTDTTKIDTNSTSVGAYDRDRRTAMSVIKGLTALGDSSDNRWLFGIYDNRRAFYEALPTSAEYQRALSDPSQNLERFGSGDVVYPWNVEPGKWMFYTDLLIGKPSPSTLRLDPRYLFIEQATFTVPWALSLEGSRVGRYDQMLAKLGLGGTSA